jgi:carbonic anhydrase
MTRMKLDDLLAGNVRAQSRGRAAAPHGDRILSAAMLTCSDERVLPELIFDAPRGKFYVVRIAGNVCTPEAAGSLELAVVRFRCPIVLVLGHSGCSIVRLTRSRERVDGAVYDITRRVRQALEPHPPDLSFDDAVAANVTHTVRQLREKSRILREREAAGELALVGAVYSLETGAVLTLREDR